MPFSFIEEQVKGDLVKYRHEHHFKEVQNGTIKIDLVDFGGTRDLIGKLIGNGYIKNYLEEMIQIQNEVIQQYAESEKWRAILTF
jgi:ligand-binding SRPBCC domain-containing protein